MASSITAVILAGGTSTRMKSRRSKVLFPLAGRSLLSYPIRAVREIGVERVVVVVGPHNEQEIRAYLARFEPDTEVALQREARGTGDAARSALELLHTDETLILCGDSPLITGQELAALTTAYRNDAVSLALLSCFLDAPFGYGRLLRTPDGQLRAIREQKDLGGPEEEAVNEVNAGVYLLETDRLRQALAGLRPNNRQGEIYLTDIVAFVASTGGRVESVAASAEALLGVNDRRQLADAEALLRRRIIERHWEAGASVDPSAQIDDTVVLDQDVEIRAGVSLRGNTRVGSGSTIDRGCVVTDSEIGTDTLVKPYCVLSSSRVGCGVELGPFAHLRPHSDIGDGARLGNFVETKSTKLHPGAKAMHLSYLGNGDVGERANIGAGTIFCNYNGYTKAETKIGAGAFVGSDCQFIAPVSVGADAMIAAGTTVVEDVPDRALALSRPAQVVIPEKATQLREKFRAGRSTS